MEDAKGVEDLMKDESQDAQMFVVEAKKERKGRKCERETVARAESGVLVRGVVLQLPSRQALISLHLISLLCSCVNSDGDARSPDPMVSILWLRCRLDGF